MDDGMSRESREINELGRRIWEEVFGPAPRSTYFRNPARERWGPMFNWLTAPLEGRWASFVHVPKGKGSRSNRAELWVLDERLTAIHDTRKEAKARALRLYRAYYEHGCSVEELADGSYLDKIREG